MDLKTRKLEFIQEFLKLRSEEAVSRFENLLNKEKENLFAENIESMTQEELNARIDQSENDFENNRFKKSSDLFSKYE